MKKFTEGIDLSKDKLHFCFLHNEVLSVLNQGVIDNEKGAIFKRLHDQGDGQHAVILEITCHSLALLTWFPMRTERRRKQTQFSQCVLK